MSSRKIDKLVHTNIMGWEESPHIAGYFRKGEITFYVPPYSDSYEHAWKVVEVLKKEKVSIKNRFINELQKLVTPEEMKRDGLLVDTGLMIFMLTPKDICVAALKAYGTEVEGEE